MVHTKRGELTNAEVNDKFFNTFEGFRCRAEQIGQTKAAPSTTATDRK